MGRPAPKPLSVTEAKQRLLHTSEKIDYLAPVKQYPLESAGAAFIAGVLWRRLSKNKLPPGLLTFALRTLIK